MTLFNRLTNPQKTTVHRGPLSQHLPFHAPNQWYRFTHFSLIIPNLITPLHYLNLRVAMGQSDIPILKNNLDSCYSNTDRVSVLSSTSPHMLAQQQCMSFRQECSIQPGAYQFSNQLLLTGDFPEFQLHQKHLELSFDLRVKTHAIISYPIKKILGLYKYWSLMSECEGEVVFKGQHYSISHIGSLEYSRIVNFPYLNIFFYTYQLIQLENQQQLMLIHIRNHFNQIIQSKILVRDLNSNSVKGYEQSVLFKVLRVYPAVKTPDHREMYLVREFEWRFKNAKDEIYIHGVCRGDFKYGLGAGFVGSFSYHVQINNVSEFGEAGYCEYIDCRPLRWQTIDEREKKIALIEQTLPIALRNEKNFGQEKE